MSTNSIGPNSNIKLGWVITLALAGASFIWFAATSTEKLNYVLRTASEPTHRVSFDVHYRTGGSPTPYNAP